MLQKLIKGDFRLNKSISYLTKIVILISIISLCSFGTLATNSSTIQVNKDSTSTSTLEYAVIHINYSSNTETISTPKIWNKKWNKSRYLGTNQLGAANIDGFLNNDSLKNDIIASFYDPIYDRQELVRINAEGTTIWNKPPGYDPSKSFRPLDDISVGDKKSYIGSDYIFTAQYQGDYSYDYAFAIDASTGSTIFQKSKTNPDNSNTKHGVVEAADLENDNSYGVLWGINNTLTYFDKDGNEVWSHEFTGTTSPIRHLRTSDINNDSKKDVLVATDLRLIVLNDSNQAILMDKAMTGPIKNIIAGDFLGDYKTEIVVANSDSVIVFDNTGQVYWTYTPTNDIVCINEGDFNSDGNSDLGMTTASNAIALNIDNKSIIWDTTVSSNGKNCKVDDMDNDDLSEIVASYGQSVYYIEDNGTITWSQTYPSFITKIISRDLDGDYVKELIFSSSDYSTIRNNELPALYESDIEPVCQLKLDIEPYWKGLFIVDGQYRFKKNFKTEGVINYTVKCNKTGYEPQTYNGSLLITLPTDVIYHKQTDYQDASNNTRYTFAADYRRIDTFESMKANMTFTLENIDTSETATKSCYGINCSVDFFIGTQSGNDLPGGNYTLTIDAVNTTDYHYNAQNTSIHYLEEPKARETDYLAVGETLFDPERANQSSYQDVWQWLYNFEVDSNYSFLYTLTLKNIHKGTMSNIDMYPHPERDISFYFNNINLVEGCESILPNEQCDYVFNISTTDNLNAEIDDITPAKIYWYFNWTNNDLTEKTCGKACTPPLSSIQAFPTRFYVYSMPNISVSPNTINIDESLSQSHYIDVYVNNTGNDKIDLINISDPFPENDDYVKYTSKFESSNNSIWHGSGWEMLSVEDYNILGINITITNYTKAHYSRIINFTTDTVAEDDPWDTIQLDIDVNPELTLNQDVYKSFHHNKDNLFNYSIVSSGNIKVNNVSMHYQEKLLPNSENILPTEWVNFDGNLGTLYEGNEYNVPMNISIPQFTSPGNYSGQFILETKNTPDKRINLTVFVKPEGSWEFVTPLTNYMGEFPLDFNGNVGNITVYNSGNLFLDFYVQRFDSNTNCTETTTGCTQDSDQEKNANYYSLERNATLDIPTYVVQVLTGDMKKIEVMVSTTTSDSEPLYNSTYVKYLTVDYPPTIQKQTTIVSQTEYSKIAQGKEATLSSRISDDLGVDYEWTYFNITMPDGTKLRFDNLTNETIDTRIGAGATLVDLEYNFTQTNQVGNYTFTTITKDNSGHIVEDDFNFTVINETDLDVITENLTVTNVTYINNSVVNLPISVYNIGLVFAYDLNISFSNLPDGWQMLNTSIKKDVVKDGLNEFSTYLDVPEKTTPGLYNFTTNITWQTPNQGKDSYTTFINVTPNHHYQIYKLNNSYDISHDNHNLKPILIHALGNEPISLDISSIGEPEDLTISFTNTTNTSDENLKETYYIEDLAQNATQKIYLDMEADRGAPPGTINREFNITFENAKSIPDKSLEITPNILESHAWNLSQDAISEGGVALLNITYEDLVITSNANVELDMYAFLQGNITDFSNPEYVDPLHNITGDGMKLTDDMFTLNISESMPVSIFYKVPDLNADFKGNITIVETSNASNKEVVTINFRSYKFISRLYNVFPTSVNFT